MLGKTGLQTGVEVREACRAGQWKTQTSGLAPGFAQANLAILPRDLAADFQEFCLRNPQPCPLLAVTEPGDPVPHRVAKEGDLRTDLPRFRVWKHGKLMAEPYDIQELWQEDFVSFLIGCSFTFEAALLRAGIPVRHLEQGLNVPMYRTRIACRPAGIFQGNLVVSMRPLTPENAARASEITAKFPAVHGAPIQIGDAISLGIENLTKPDFGEAVRIDPGEIPVFWACGVTPQAAIMCARPPLAITHSPGCMFVTDLRDEALRVD